MLAIAAIVFWQAEKGLEAQALRSLQDESARYGREIQDRLLRAWDLLSIVGAADNVPSEAVSHLLDAYVVLSEDGDRIAGELELPESVAGTISTHTFNGVVANTITEDATLYIARSIGDRTAVGLLCFRSTSGEVLHSLTPQSPVPLCPPVRPH